MKPRRFIDAIFTPLSRNRDNGSCEPSTLARVSTKLLAAVCVSAKMACACGIVNTTDCIVCVKKMGGRRPFCELLTPRSSRCKIVMHTEADDLARELFCFVSRDDVRCDLAHWHDWQCVNAPRNVVRFASRAVLPTLGRMDPLRDDVRACVEIGEILASAANVGNKGSIDAALGALRVMREFEQCATWASEGGVMSASGRVIEGTGHPHFVALGRLGVALKRFDAERLIAIMVVFADFGHRFRHHGHAAQFLV